MIIWYYCEITITNTNYSISSVSIKSIIWYDIIMWITNNYTCASVIIKCILLYCKIICILYIYPIKIILEYIIWNNTIFWIYPNSLIWITTILNCESINIYIICINNYYISIFRTINNCTAFFFTYKTDCFINLYDLIIYAFKNKYNIPIRCIIYCILNTCVITFSCSTDIKSITRRDWNMRFFYIINCNWWIVTNTKK